MADEKMDESTLEEKTILTYEEQLSNCNEIATPMASKKLVKRLYKSINQ